MPEIDKAVSKIFQVKMKQSGIIKDNLVTVDSGGPQPLTFAPITVARKQSDKVSSRTVRSRSKQNKELMAITSGDSVEAVSAQTSHLVKSLDVSTRESTSLFYDHPFIPLDEINLKIGGDHGGGSFKASFQIGNVFHPNQINNTVIFSIMEAKDYRFNLLLCLERFKAHGWKGKTFRIFLFGDYEFLCAMYELSGAAGKHPCLWCTISSDMLVIPLSERGRCTPRTLDSLTENYKKYKGEFNGIIKKAKFCFNVN